MPSRWSNQQFRGSWSWYGRLERLNEAGRSWTWSSSQKGDGEWKYWSPGNGRSGPTVLFLLVASLLLLHLIHPWTNLQSRHTAHSWKWFLVTAVHSQRKFLSLSNRNLQPRRRHGLRNSSVSLPLSVTTSPWLVTKPRWNAIWRQPKTSFQELSAHCN